MSGEYQDEINIKTVRQIAFLARLELSDADAEAFSRQINTILEHFKLLRDATIPADPTLGYSEERPGLLREDEVGSTLAREEFLASVPRRQGAFVLVPTVFPLDDGAGQAEAEI